MGLMSRRKGAGFERGVAILLRCIWAGAKRGIGQARSGGEVPDVDGTPYWIETKHRRRVCIRAAYEQAREASDGRPPVVISRENGGPILVTMGVDEWMTVVGRQAAKERLEGLEATNRELDRQIAAWSKKPSTG